jgi:ABC-2 type transport system ATP-binding protein
MWPERSPVSAAARAAGAVRPALEARGLTKRYGRTRYALRGIDLCLSGPGITALVGPNAAGKSTLMRSWLGFERPTAGSCTVRGYDPQRHRALVLELIGYVPQQAQVYRELSVADHVHLVGRLRPRFSAAAAMSRLDSLNIPPDARGRELSGGQQAQVLLAMALASGAEILLLDEPLTHLDPLARREFLQVVRSWVAEHRTLAVLSSHVITDVEQVCDTLIALGVGRVMLNDTVAGALASHVVSLAEDTHRGSVGTFVGQDGRGLSLYRRGSAPPTARPATLEEIVLGHLAAARGADQW